MCVAEKMTENKNRRTHAEVQERICCVFMFTPLFFFFYTGFCLCSVQSEGIIEPPHTSPDLL